MPVPILIVIIIIVYYCIMATTYSITQQVIISYSDMLNNYTPGIVSVIHIDDSSHSKYALNELN